MENYKPTAVTISQVAVSSVTMSNNINCIQVLPLFIFLLLMPLSTSQPIPSSATPTQAPFIEVDGCVCRRDNPANCTTLQEAIDHHYDRIDFNADTPYNFFTLKDLFYAGILDHGPNGDLQPPPIWVDFGATRELELTRRRCSRLAGHYISAGKDTEQCTWTNHCRQMQQQFPSFYIEAVLDHEPTNGICSPQKIRNKRFVSSICEHDSSVRDWMDCDCGEVVVGFKYEAL